MSSDTTRRYVVAYDVRLDWRRTRIAHTLEGFGDRVQYSVFLVDAKPSRLLRLQAKLIRYLDLETDSILLFDLGPLEMGASRRMTTIGIERPHLGRGPLVV